MSERVQTIMIWWTLGFMAIYGAVMWGMLSMIPPPSPTLSPAEVGAFYTDNNLRIRLGAVIASWISAFMVPFSVVVSVQMLRLSKGIPVWSIMQFAGGIMMSIFLVLPPLFWGVAAFSPERMPEITTLMHELGTLTLVTTDQYFIFQMVPIAVIALTASNVAHNPFPRWIGYLTIWAALMFEVGALAFIPKTGPFAWNGLLVFWFPLIIFGVWVTVMSFSLLRALKLQRLDAMQG